MRAVDNVRHNRATMGHGVFGTVTAAAWTLYVYLWLPAITLLAWAAGLRTAWVQSVLERAGVDLGQMWLLLGLVVLFACALLLWAQRQRTRFTGVERRHHADDVDPESVARSLGVGTEVLRVLQAAVVATVHLDADGRPVRVVAVAAAAATVPAQRRPVDAAPRPAESH